ncbi:MAG: hypothetical protein LAO21_21505 [Acidobacteriia bacterium]|nr:hypothetical protein [Terriglobia bacterium]
MTVRWIRQALLRLDDYRNGDKRLSYLPEVKRECTLPREELLSRQWDRVLKILDLAYEQIPFYRDRFQEAGITPKSIQAPSDLSKIPFLTREDLRNHQRELMNPLVRPEDLIQTATGGTTDSPVHLALDRECFARRRACTLHFQRWWGAGPGDRVASLWGAEQDYSRTESFRSRVRGWVLGRALYLPSSYLNDGIMQGYYEKLVEFRPKTIQAYPTPLYLFACFLEKNNLQLPIHSINVAAEYLYGYQREKIESVFSTRIYNWYGAREVGHIATECSIHQGMHLNCYGLYVEAVKDEKLVENEPGDLIFTDLFNRAMPIIRYRIGDLGVISARACACGSALPLLEEVTGRSTDAFWNRDGSFTAGASFCGRIMKECQGIKQLQIIQKDFERFQLNVVKGANFREKEVEELKQRIGDFLHAQLTFDVVFVNEVLPEPSGKVIFCKSEVGRALTPNREGGRSTPV